MPETEKRLVIEEKKMFVGFPHIRRPVLPESDHDTIWEESGRQVQARTREHQGSIKLLLKAPSTCDDDTLVAASERAIGFIEYNHAHPSPPTVRTKAKTSFETKVCRGRPYRHRRTTGRPTRRRCPWNP